MVGSSDKRLWWTRKRLAESSNLKNTTEILRGITPGRSSVRNKRKIQAFYGVGTKNKTLHFTQWH